MTTAITYYPDRGISFDQTNINWDTARSDIRSLLGNQHKESDSIIDLSEYHNGSKEFNINQRRDIYQNYWGEDNYFFLNYDRDDMLKEMEIHYGIEIFIKEIRLNFGANFQEMISLLQTISSQNKQLSEGEYFFKDLKLTIADAQSMGGEGVVLAYFYCTNNIDHLSIDN